MDEVSGPPADVGLELLMGEELGPGIWRAGTTRGCRVGIPGRCSAWILCMCWAETTNGCRAGAPGDAGLRPPMGEESGPPGDVGLGLLMGEELRPAICRAGSTRGCRVGTPGRCRAEILNRCWDHCWV